MSYVSNVINRKGSPTIQNDFKSTYTKVTRGPINQISSMVPLPILKNITIVPVSKVPNDSSKTISLNKKDRGTGTVLSQSKEQFAATNFKISKEITISPINEVENSIMLLKKLPNITLQVVNPKPVFKIPDSPKPNLKKIGRFGNKSKIIPKSKVLSERQNNNIIIDENKNSKLLDVKNLTVKNSSFHKSSQNNCNLVQKPIDNNTVLTKHNYDKIISKSLEEIPKKYSYSEKENTNTQKTSSPNKLPKQSLSFPNIKSKNLMTMKPVNKNSVTSTNPHKMENILDNNSTLNNIENNAHELEKDYLLMDLSNEGEINIIPAHRPSDFINVSLPEYDSFAMGISKSPGESNLHLETYHNYIEKQEFNFSNNQSYINSLPTINQFIDVSTNLAPQSAFNSENAG